MENNETTTQPQPGEIVTCRLHGEYLRVLVTEATEDGQHFTGCLSRRIAKYAIEREVAEMVAAGLAITDLDLDDAYLDDLASVTHHFRLDHLVPGTTVPAPR